jgi:signal transduction histidine kinase
VPGRKELSTDDNHRVVSALRDMARASMADDRETIVAELIRISVDVTSSDRGGLYLLDESRSHLSLVATWPPDDALGRAIPSIDVETTHTGHQMRSGITGAFSVAEASAPPAVIDAGVKHWATVPLEVRGRLVGALNIARNRDERFAVRELRVADMLAEVLVIHVENARLDNDVKRQLDETHILLDVGRALSVSLDLDGILDTAVQTLTRIVNASTAFVMLLDDGGGFLRGVATSNPKLNDFIKNLRIDMATTSLLSRAIAERRPIPIDDVTTVSGGRRDVADLLKEKSVLAAPLLARDNPIGVVVIDDTRNPRKWTPQEIKLTELVAHQVAAAIANARLFAEARIRSEQLARAHQQMVERERLAALGQFAATLAHEIRNPLCVLTNSVGALTKRKSPDGEEASLLAMMDEETRRLDRLVRELLEFARPRAPTLEVCSLPAVVDGAIEAASAELVPLPISVVVDIASDLPEVQLDPFMIRQALSNLVLNAGQAAGPNGAIVVRARVNEQGKLRVDVIDDGQGISPEHAKRIFEPFFTTKPTGTGLGLVIVKSIVDSHNGELHVSEGLSGRGTTVSVVLPIGKDSRVAL